MAMDQTYSTASATGWSSLTLAHRARTPGLATRIKHWWQEQQEISRVTRELSLHTDRELHDMGLTRGDIPAIARGTYYLP